MAQCEYCDSHVEDGITTCPHCGASIKYTAAETEAAQEVTQTEQETVQTEVTTEENPIQEFLEDITSGFDGSGLGTAAAMTGIGVGTSLLGKLFGRKSNRPVPPQHFAPNKRRYDNTYWPGRPDGAGVHRRRPAGAGSQSGHGGGMNGKPGGMGGAHGGGHGGRPGGSHGGPGGRR